MGWGDFGARFVDEYDVAFALLNECNRVVVAAAAA